MRKVARIALAALGGVVALTVLAAIVLNIYLATRPVGKTIKSAGIVSIRAPFKPGRPFIDYMAIDGPRLYGNIDTESNQIGTVGGLGRVHGIAIVPERELGFASSSGDNSIDVFELGTNKLLKKIPAGDDPDAIIYDERVGLARRLG